jgi:hypothetical protein
VRHVQQYLILGEEDPSRVNAAVANIKTFAPDVILNTVNGTSSFLLRLFVWCRIQREC